MSTHTPGPWRVADSPSRAILAPSPSGKPDRYTQVIYFDGDNYFYQSPGDAALIAAAPDMASLLDRTEWFLRNIPALPPDGAELLADICGVRAKAEGRS